VIFLPSRDIVHPSIKTLMSVTGGQPGIADMPPAQARNIMAIRTANRAKGPAVQEIRDLLIPGSQGEIPVRFYRPEGARGVCVVLHGGGWLMGNLDSFDATSRYLAKESGQGILSVDYRLAPEHPFPASLEDAWAALSWAANNASTLRVDSTRMAVLGESAGGNLAAVICLMARDHGALPIKLQVLVYAPVDARLAIESLNQFADGYLQSARDVHHAFKTYGLGSTASANDWRISPLLAQSHRGLPPALLISAGCDALRDDSLAYTTKLLDAEVPAIHVCYPGMVHTFFGMRGVVPDAEHAQKVAAAGIRDAIG
jgi:acetyl esterase